MEIVDRLVWSWRRWAVGLAAGALPGFAFGEILWWAIRGENFVPGYHWRFALVIALTAGVIVGIVLGFNGLGMERSVRPNQGIWRSAQNAVRIGLAIWLGVGVSLGLLLADAWRLALGGMQVLEVGAAVFLGVGLSFGNHCQPVLWRPGGGAAQRAAGAAEAGWPDPLALGGVFGFRRRSCPAAESGRRVHFYSPPAARVFCR